MIQASCSVGFLRVLRNLLSDSSIRKLEGIVLIRPRLLYWRLFDLRLGPISKSEDGFFRSLVGLAFGENQYDLGILEESLANFAMCLMAWISGV